MVEDWTRFIDIGFVGIISLVSDSVYMSEQFNSSFYSKTNEHFQGGVDSYR
jgi:hypothetical protein